jgi:DNA topoisomerase II
MSRQIEKLRQQAVEKEAELLALLERTPIEVWNKDLDRFLAEWEVCFGGQLLRRASVTSYRNVATRCLVKHGRTRLTGIPKAGK